MVTQINQEMNGHFYTPAAFTPGTEALTPLEVRLILAQSWREGFGEERIRCELAVNWQERANFEL